MHGFNRRKKLDTTKQVIFSKVPEVTLLFWVIKILATTLGETGGDAVSMSMDLGYLVGTGIFAVIFIVAVIAQVSAQRFYPVLYSIPSPIGVGDFRIRSQEGWPEKVE